MSLILAAPKRPDKSSRGTPRLRRPRRHCVALRALLQGTAAVAGAKMHPYCVELQPQWQLRSSRRQGRRPRVFGLAGFKPALTKVQPSVANGSQPHARLLPIAALARP